MTDTVGRAAWLEDRQTGLGGSDIAAVLGIRGSRMAVWMSKVDPIDPANRPAPTNRMRWGKRLEGAMLEEYAELTGETVEAMGEVVMRHPDHEWWIGSPDAATVDPVGPPRFRRGIECKTAGLDQAWRWGEAGSDLVPDNYALQALHYAPLLGVETFDLYVLIAGNDDRIYTLQRDHELEAVIAEEGHAFWRDHVLTKVPPPIDASDAAARYLRSRFPRNIVDVREATPMEVELALRVERARQIASEAEELKDMLENELRASIGDADGLIVNGQRITWKKSKDTSRTAWKEAALEAGVPADVIERHTVPVEGTRRLYWPRKGISNG